MAGTEETAGVRRYSLKLSNYSRLTGASMAVRAISDGVMLLHAGVGCKYKGASQQAHHDRAIAPHHREGFTEVTDHALIKGSSRNIGPSVRSWHAKRKPGIITVVPATFLELTGEDIAAEVERASKTVDCPVELVRCPGYEGDMYQGYADVVRVVLEKIPFKSKPPVRGRAAVAGFLFDRYEADAFSNIAEITRLLRMAGIESAPFLMSGRPFASLMEAADAERIIRLPYGCSAAEMVRISGRPVVDAGLPVGFTGTFNWLRKVAAAFNRDPRPIEAWIRSQVELLKPRLQQFRNAAHFSMMHRRAAIIADTYYAAGLCGLFLEAGIQPGLVVFRDESLGGAETFGKVLSELRLTLPAGVEMLENPPLPVFNERLSAMLRSNELGVIAGAKPEISAVYNTMKGRAGGFTAEDSRYPMKSEPILIETGFPSGRHHVIAEHPVYGINGALNFLQRIMDRMAYML
jgi:nitrogenase molybdenum-iron protein alpha/beta subunit